MHRLATAEWGWPEYRAMARALAAPNRRDALERLEPLIGAFFPQPPLLLVNRPRFGLELALRVFTDRRRARSEVIIPAYICASVPATIERCGLTPVPVDIHDELNIDLAAV